MPRNPNPPNLTQRNAVAPARVIKKRKNLSYAQKLEIVKCIESGQSKREVGRKFEINESTVRGIYQKRDHIKSHMRIASSSRSVNALRSPNQVLLKTEQLMWRYVDRQAKRNKSVDTRDLMDTAMEIYGRVAVKLGVDNPPPFNASKGWMQKFEKRLKVKNVLVSGEAASADKDAARSYPEALKNIIESGQYTPDQIFNMDETNFFWKNMPRRTFITQSSVKVRGRKPMKERFTLLFAMNASGTCRLKPTVVHKAKRPRPYKGLNMKRLNVCWLSSKKGYMSAKLSLDWFKEFFVPEVEKFCADNNIRFNILLLLDNAPGHSPLLRTENPNVKVEFLPPNTTSLIQPLDQEVISVVKAAYTTRQFREMRRATEDEHLLQQLVDSDDDATIEEGDSQSEIKVTRFWKNFNIKNAVDMLVECWNTSVTQATVNHAWRNILEGMPEDRQVNVPGEPQSVDDAVEAAAEEARRIAGRGFDETTGDDIREMIRPANISPEELLQDDEEFEDEEEGNEEEIEGEEERVPGLPMADVKRIIELGGQLMHLMEQDSLPNTEERTSFIKQALAGYEDRYHDHINALQQRQITEYFRQQPDPHHPQQDSDADPQPGPSGLARPQPLEDSSSDSEFEGFDDILSEVEGRMGVQERPL